jgi:hypothetical protein
MKQRIVIAFLSLVLGTHACSSLMQPTPTAIPTSTFTFTPSLAPTATVTQTPTSTALPPTQTPDVISGLLPAGEPESEWNGIPIMPGAIAGDGDAGAYRFTIQASRVEIQAYYESELRKLGWTLLAAGEGEAGNVIMIFTGEGGTLSVSLIRNEDEFIVMLVK